MFGASGNLVSVSCLKSFKKPVAVISVVCLSCPVYKNEVKILSSFIKHCETIKPIPCYLRSEASNHSKDKQRPKMSVK